MNRNLFSRQKIESSNWACSERGDSFHSEFFAVLRGIGTRTAIDFKWADNLQHPGDILDFYLSGDVAPDGRFNYRYAGE